MREAAFKNTVIELAKWRGWLVHHDLPAMRRNGSWATNVQGDSGFPDLVLAKAGIVIFAELKRETGTTTKAQDTWLANLPDTFPVYKYVWRPSDMADIKRILG